MAHTCSRVTLEQVEAAGTPSIASLSLMVWLAQFMHDFLPSFGTQPLSGGCCVPFTEHTAVAQWGVCLGCRFVSFFFLLCSPCFFIMCSRAVVIFALNAVTSVTIDRVLAWILATLSAPASLTGHRAFEGILCLRQLLGALMVVLS